MGTSFYRFVTMHAFDRQTDRRTVTLSQYRALIKCSRTVNKMLRYRKETALQGALILATSERLELGENIFTDIIGLFNHCDIIGLRSYSVKTRNNRYCAVQGHSRSSRSVPIESPCDFVLVINSKWHPISYCFAVIAAYCSALGQFAFLSPSLGV